MWFNLCVGDFGIKYTGREHLQHLYDALQRETYEIVEDWTGNLYCGITLKCVDHLRPTTDKPVKMYCHISPPKMYWYTLGQTVVALAHRYCQTTNNVDRELTELP
jgi:hypothetical protein